MSNRNEAPVEPHTAAWNFQVWASFALAFGMTVFGLVLLPIDMWARGYLLMGTVFTVGSTFTLSKTVRDNHEARRLRNRITTAKTDRLLKEFELTEAA